MQRKLPKYAIICNKNINHLSLGIWDLTQLQLKRKSGDNRDIIKLKSKY